MLCQRLWACNTCLQGVLKKGQQFPTELAKAQLRGSFTARLLPQLHLTRGALLL